MVVPGGGEVVGGAEEGAEVGTTLYRVVECGEAEALEGSGGIPGPSPFGQEAKPFWTSLGYAEAYQNGVRNWGKGDCPVWEWRNPDGVGEAGPPLDWGKGPSWHVPNDHLPLLGPGRRI